VHDVIRALVDLRSRDDVYGEVFNIGSREEISMLELAREVRDAACSDSEIVLIPYDEAYGEGFEDMPRRVPDTSKVEKWLGWQATASLSQILEDVVKDVRHTADSRVPAG
jgi:UDP-glucose 4-epimerase